MAKRGVFDIFLLAGRYTLLQHKPLETFLPLCVEKGISIVIGGPHNSGVLAASVRVGEYYNNDPAPEAVWECAAKIEEVCDRHGVRLVDTALQFPLCHPAVVSVILDGQGLREMQSKIRVVEADILEALWSDLKAEGPLREDAPT